ncbi:hypothetical protein BKI52_30275 [marine bacterium AO1-C]|nr:hypothetical protein BKI52_30275 [marine bacterium AO1-C]
MFGYAIWSLYIWSKNQQEDLKNRILSDSSQLIAHWHYNANRWRQFSELALKKGRKATFLGLWIFGAILLLITVLVMYFNSQFRWSALQYAFIGFIIFMALGYLLATQHQNRKRRIFLESIKPEVHLSTYGALINREWTLPFKQSNVDLIQVDKVHLHQETCLCFTVKISSGEGDALKKHHIPVPQNEMEHLPKVLEAFQESISITQQK